MKRKLIVFCLIVCIPATALIAGYGLSSRLRHQWTETIASTPEARDNLGQLTDRAQALLNLSSVCTTGAATDISDLCTTDSNYTALIHYSSLTLIGSLLLLAVIELTGRIARHYRSVLLAFVPGMFLVVALVAVLTLVDSCLLVASLYLVTSAFLSRIPIGFMAAIALGAIVAVLKMLGSLRLIRWKAEIPVRGELLNLARHPALSAILSDLCRKLGSQLPDNVIVGLDLNFFVTESSVRCLNGVVKGRTLFLSLPLCRILNIDELTAVMAHELAHFVGRDTRFSRSFYPVYTGTRESVAALFSHGSSGGASAIASLPSALVLSSFLESFQAAERKVSRDRELKADALAALATSSESISSALVKLSAFTPLWKLVEEDLQTVIREQKQLINLSLHYFRTIVRCASQVKFATVAQDCISHPIDSHPPLGVRLASLMRTLEQIEPRAANLEGDDAIRLFPDHIALEEHLSDVENSIWVQRMQVSVA